MPIKAILMKAKASVHLVGSKLNPLMVGVGMGFVILRDGPAWAFAKSFYKWGPHAYNMRGNLNRSVALVHRSNNWFRWFVTRSMPKRFNRVNRIRNVTGRQLNWLDRPVWSDFQNIDNTIVSFKKYAMTNIFSMSWY